MPYFSPFRLTLWGPLLGALLVGQAAQARSSLAPRFGEEPVAGPGVEQSLPLYLHYFAGDGEAVLNARLDCEPGSALLRQVHSSLGRARLTKTAIEIDYRDRPLGGERVDTLHLTLLVQSAAPLVWRGALSTTADTNLAPGGVTRLLVAPPLQVEVNLRPEAVFAGEQVRLEAEVYNADTRPLAQVAWEWPQGLLVAPAAGAHRWGPPLAPGARDTLVWQGRIGAEAAGPLVVQGRAGSPQVAGSPVSTSPLQVMAAPAVQLEVLGGTWLEKGTPGRVRCRLQNTGEAPLDLDAWRLEIPAAFTGARVAAHSQGQALLLEREVAVKGVGSLPPGQALELELEITPQRPGPFNWNAAFRPAGRTEFIPAAGQALLRVAESAGAPVDQTEAGPPTDLELLRRAFVQTLDDALGQLPLAPGARVCLEPLEKSDLNWVLDDALVAALLRRGYEVLLKPEPSAAALHYRLADSRVIHAPGSGGWNPFAGRQRREAYGELYLRLEDPDHRLLWARRAQAYQADEVPPGRAGAQTASALFKSTRVEDRHKGIERGLSASILGGLFYIFFIP
ncbi:MAG: hypothetical protein FJY95_04690 [Candidatus Handelsmanbacteria bacterium]|nr:hypothetical protein [Candidatus Handelsmanbacteria bacterium]